LLDLHHLIYVATLPEKAPNQEKQKRNLATYDVNRDVVM
jgi:hypothetical protein